MKFLALALIVTVALCARPNRSERAFNLFVEEYGKTYASPAERARRMAIFKENQRTAALLDRLDSTATYGLSPFMDMTEMEFITLYSNPITVPANRVTTVVNEDYPPSWDWNEQGFVTPAQDQGGCGSCWAFATVGSSESAWAIAGGDLMLGSEQELLDCDHSDAGCSGGNLDTGFTFLEEHGIMSDADYPYTGKKGRCKYDEDKVIITISSHTDLPEGDEDSLLSALYNYGPVAVTINATPLQYYTSGILNPEWCSPRMIDHAVLLVGYGTEDNVDFWNVKNSWGANWGEDGFFRIVRGTNACGIAEWAVVAHV